jgi:hypothetical protein
MEPASLDQGAVRIPDTLVALGGDVELEDECTRGAETVDEVIWLLLMSLVYTGLGATWGFGSQLCLWP